MDRLNRDMAPTSQRAEELIRPCFRTFSGNAAEKPRLSHDKLSLNSLPTDLIRTSVTRPG